MNKKTILIISIFTLFAILSGCGWENGDQSMQSQNQKSEYESGTIEAGTSSVMNFSEFESTEWSIVFNQGTGEVHYYHRENYRKKYIFQIG